MLPPSEPTPARPRRRPISRILFAVLLATGVVAAFVYTGLNPARLMAQARYVGPVKVETPAKPEFGGLAYKLPDESCPDCTIPTQPRISSFSRFPFSATLPDGRRSVTLLRPESDDPSDSPKTNRPPAKCELHLASLDSPSRDVLLLDEVFEGVRSLVGVTDDLTLVASSEPPPAESFSMESEAAIRPVTLFRFGIVGNTSGEHQTEVIQPAPGAVREMAVAPRGDRILWAIRSQRKPYKFVAALAGVAPPLGRFAATRRVLSLWETDDNGKKAVKIAEEAEALPGDSGRVANLRPQRFHYTPDGSRIRFAFGSDIYEVPAAAR